MLKMEKDFEKSGKKEIIKPNVLVPGFPRAGTSYLYNLLKQHEDVDVTEEKEIGWWRKFPLLTSHPHLINLKFFYPKSWYYKKFKLKKAIRMDFSVMAAYDKTSAERIKKELGDIKIIFIIRDRGAHEKSIRNTLIKQHGEKIKCDTSIFSNFDEYIDEYKKVFSEVLIVDFAEMTKKPDSFLKKVFTFLELKQQKIDTDIYKKAYKVKYEERYKIKFGGRSRKEFMIFRAKRNMAKIISYIATVLLKNSKIRE
jgi:hypothetical protein